MAKPKDRIFADNYICIGEDHEGRYAFNFSNSDDCAKLTTFIVNKKFNITLWYEGESETNTGKSFPQFKSDLKEYLTRSNLKPTIKIDGWDRGGNYKRIDVIAGILLGANYSNIVDIIGTQALDGKQTLLSVYADSFKNFKTRELGSITLSQKEIIAALSNGTKPSDVLALMQQPKSATKETLKKIYGDERGGSYKAMRAKYFKRDAHSPASHTPLISSAVFKRVERFNDARDDNLAQKIKHHGGIFLMGDGHVDAVRSRLR